MRAGWTLSSGTSITADHLPGLQACSIPNKAIPCKVSRGHSAQHPIGATLALRKNMQISTFSSDTYIHQFSHKPSLAAASGGTFQPRKSPVLSRQELQRVILEILG